MFQMRRTSTILSTGCIFDLHSSLQVGWKGCRFENCLKLIPTPV